MKDKVIVLMATYNGEKYLSEQIDSIVNQTHTNWELWIRDDCSQDSTLDIIKKYTAIDSRIRLYSDNLKNLGPVRNFGTLLENVQFEQYVMFSDQDDVWMSSKIADTLKKMKQEESASSRDKPILIYSLFKIVDHNLVDLNIKQRNIPNKITINHIISNNFIHGCTMMLNRSLIELVNPISNKAENHDYWIALIAAYCGTVSSVGKATMLYRQHDSNVTGNHKNNTIHLRIKRLISGKYNELIKQRIIMLESLSTHLTNKNIDTSFLENYILAMKAGRITALRFLFENRTHKYGLGIPANIMNIISSFNYRD